MTKANIKGTIVSDDDKWIYDWFGISAVCPAEIHKAIEEAAGDDLEVEINSGGGDVLAGNEIYTALRMYKGNVTITISGSAMSAASYIATARTCQMTPVGIFMIHNVSGGARGDYHAMDKESELLQTVNRAITAAYMEKTHMSQKDLLDLMDKELWLTAEEALQYGFIDSILESQEQQTPRADQTTAFFHGKKSVAMYNTATILDQETIEKTKKMLTLNLKKVEETGMAGTQETITTVEELTQNYPTLVQQIKDLENERLKAIDEIANQLPDTLVMDAKYGKNKITAETLALEAFKKNKVIAQTTLSDLKSDIKESGVNDVEVTANTGFTDNSEEVHLEKIKNLAKKLRRE